jgi:hypothetical protein
MGRGKSLSIPVTLARLQQLFGLFHKSLAAFLAGDPLWFGFYPAFEICYIHHPAGILEIAKLPSRVFRVTNSKCNKNAPEFH